MHYAAVAARSHIVARRSAARAYAALLRDSTISPLSREQRRRIREFAQEKLGSIHYAPWLKVFTAYRGEFMEGWIPDNFFSLRVLKRVNGSYDTISDAKTLSRQVLRTNMLPDKAYFINGAWLDVDYQGIDPSRLTQVLFDEGDTVFVKRESSSRGRGVQAIDRASFDGRAFVGLGNFVVQRAVKPGLWSSRLQPQGAATLRITTTAAPGKPPKKCAAYLRLGRFGALVLKSEEQIRVPVIDDTGSLGMVATDFQWNRYVHHPDTGNPFFSERIPFFEDAVRACESLHCGVPQFAIIGWDVAITDEGRVELMEWNTNHPDFKFSEASTGPCFRDMGWERFAYGGV